MTNIPTLYKIKQEDYVSLNLKSLIDAQGNEDDWKEFLNRYCSTYPPTGLRVLESVAALYVGTVYKTDVKSAFLKTAKYFSHIYVRTPREVSIKSTRM